MEFITTLLACLMWSMWVVSMLFAGNFCKNSINKRWPNGMDGKTRYAVGWVYFEVTVTWLPLFAYWTIKGKGKP